jgi:hypothetical protein
MISTLHMHLQILFFMADILMRRLTQSVNHAVLLGGGNPHFPYIYAVADYF